MESMVYKFLFTICLLLGLSAHAQAQTAQAIVTYNNNNTTGATTSGTITHDGTLLPAPQTSIAAGHSDGYTNTGIGNVTSVHVTYTNGTKQCKFDAAGNANGAGCLYTKAGTSQGTTTATCTATITSESSMKAPPVGSGDPTHGGSRVEFG